MIPAARRAKLHTLRRQAQALSADAAYREFEREKELYLRGLICEKCEGSFGYIREPCCRKCGRQLADHGSLSGPGENLRLCSGCAEKDRRFVRCRCLLTYDEVAREIMADIKYNSGKQSLDLFAVMAADRLGGWIRSCGVSVLVPVPVHPARLRKRGYNQAEVFARRLGSLMGIPVRNDLLKRSRNTAAQKNLDVRERLLNLQNAFALTGKKLSGESVLLADDIYTTGSTMEACTEYLLKAGAGNVYGICICAAEDLA